MFAIVWTIRPVPPEGAGRADTGWSAVRQGFAYLRGRRVLQAAFGADLVAIIFGMPRALFPLIAISQFGEGATVVGLLFAAPAVGAVLGALTGGWVRRVHHQGLAVLWAIVVWGASIAAFGLGGIGSCSPCCCWRSPAVQTSFFAIFRGRSSSSRRPITCEVASPASTTSWWRVDPAWATSRPAWWRLSRRRPRSCPVDCCASPGRRSSAGWCHRSEGTRRRDRSRSSADEAPQSLPSCPLCPCPFFRKRWRTPFRAIRCVERERVREPFHLRARLTPRRRIEQDLRDAKGQSWLRDQFVHQGARRVQCLPRLGDPIDEAMATGLLGREEPSGEDALLGQADPDVLQQTECSSRSGQDAEANLGEAHECRRVGDPRLQASASSHPPPRAWPFSAATVGNGSASRAWRMPCTRPSSAAKAGRSASSPMSAPAANARSPAPVKIMPLTAWSALSRSITDRNSSQASDIALRRSGRSIVTTATPSSTTVLRAGFQASLVWYSYTPRRSCGRATRPPRTGRASGMGGNAHRGLVEVPEDAQPDIQPDQVTQLERSHREAQSELHRLVDLLGRSHALHEHVPSLIADRRAEPAGRGPGPVGDDDRFLARVPHPRSGGPCSDRLLTGRESRDHLDQGHPVGWS